jgi:predicted exporter
MFTTIRSHVSLQQLFALLALSTICLVCACGPRGGGHELLLLFAVGMLPPALGTGLFAVSRTIVGKTLGVCLASGPVMVALVLWAGLRLPL